MRLMDCMYALVQYSTIQDSLIASSQASKAPSGRNCRGGELCLFVTAPAMSQEEKYPPYTKEISIPQALLLNWWSHPHLLHHICIIL